MRKKVCLSLTLFLSLSLTLFLSFPLPPFSFFFFFPCDGCKAVDHAPDLSVFLIKILYLQAQGKKVESTQ